MDKFKIGDEVKYISNNWGDTIDNPLWNGQYGKTIGVVKEVFTNILRHDKFNVTVTWNNGGFAYYENSDLELIQRLSKQLNLFQGE